VGSLSSGRHRLFTVSPGPATPGPAQHSPLYTAAQLSAAGLSRVFLDILNTVEREWVEVVHTAQHSSWQFEGTFSVEEETRTDLTVTLSLEDEQKVKSFAVVDPTGRRNIFSKFEDGLVIIRAAGRSPAGQWSYNVQLYQDTELPEQVWVDVTTRSKSGRGVTVRPLPAWRDPAGHPVLGVEVLAGGRPVRGAAVQAKLDGPGGQVILELRDTGTGYPDTTSGDGVYTAYVPVFASQPGYHALTITAESRAGRTGRLDPPRLLPCCGFTLPADTEEAVESFRREVRAPSLYLERAVAAGRDVTPPSRIPDLRVTATNTTALLVSLTWSAPGGDLDSGMVAGYEIRCHTDPSSLAEGNFSSRGILVHPAPSPLPAPYLTTQTATAAIPWTNQLFYYAVVGLDQAGNRGQVSNLIRVQVVEETTEPATTLGPTPALSLGSPSWLLSTNHIYVIGGCAGGFLLIISIVIIVMICKAKWQKTEKTRDMLDTYEAGFYPDIKLSKPESAKSEPAVYDWLDTLQPAQQPPAEQRGEGRGGEQGGDLCYEEGSSCSRPTTSTDDSISHEDNTEYHSSGSKNSARQTIGDRSGGSDAAQVDTQQLARSRLYNSFKQTGQPRYPAYTSQHRYAYTPDWQPQPGPAAPHAAEFRKKRHESVV